MSNPVVPNADIDLTGAYPRPGLKFRAADKPTGESWFTHIRRRIIEYEHLAAVESKSSTEFAKRRIPHLRFSSLAMRELRKDISMAQVWAMSNPEDFDGQYPTRLFGCKVFTTIAGRLKPFGKPIGEDEIA